MTEKRSIPHALRGTAAAVAFLACWLVALSLLTALLHPAITGTLSGNPAQMRLALELLSLASVAAPTVLFARLRPPAEPRTGALVASGLGAVFGLFWLAARSGRTGLPATSLSARHTRRPTSPSGPRRVSPTPPSRRCSSAALPSTPCANRSASSLRRLSRPRCSWHSIPGRSQTPGRRPPDGRGEPAAHRAPASHGRARRLHSRPPSRGTPRAASGSASSRSPTTTRTRSRFPSGAARPYRRAPWASREARGRSSSPRRSASR